MSKRIDFSQIRTLAGTNSHRPILKEPIWDGRTYRAKLVIGTSPEHIHSGWIIEAIQCPFDISIIYSDDGTKLRGVKGEYVVGIWHSRNKGINIMSAPPNQIGQMVEEGLRKLTGDNNARLSQLPWNVINRRDLTCLGPLGEAIDKAEMEKVQQRARLDTLTRSKTPEQHWAEFKRDNK